MKYFDSRKAVDDPSFPAWKSLYYAACYDYISFLVIESIYYSMTTSLWMLPHALEKFLKAWLLKGGIGKRNVRDLGHNICSLWNECKKKYKDDFDRLKFEEELAFSIGEIDTNSRYGAADIFVPDELFVRIIPFFNEIRNKILKSDYNREYYGIPESILNHSATIEIEWLQGKMVAEEVVRFYHQRAYLNARVVYRGPEEDEGAP